MASTSDSDDFASADEDIQEENEDIQEKNEDRQIKHPIPSLKSACQQELEKQKPAVQVVTVTDENALSQELSKLQVEPSRSSSVADTKDMIDNSDQAVPDTTETEPPIERRRRQQKVREPKSSSGPKKLGTKITPSKTPDSPIDDAKQPDINKPSTADSSEVDPYAKFRGFSVPPIMQRCVFTDPQTGELILDKNVKKVMSREDVVTNESNEAASTSSEPDPYAKFRGYSEPPLIEGCWEEGVNKVPAKTEPSEEKSKDTESHKEPKEPDSSKDSDPYAKFRGYSDPPLIERCWEEGVDDVAAKGSVDVSSQKEKESCNEENLAPVFDKLTKAAESSSGGGWGSWGNWSVGVTSLLSSASDGVSTLTSQVTSVLESTIGVPTPEEMAQALREKKLAEEAKSSEAVSEAASGDHSTGLFGFMSNVTKMVETTGSKVITGGLDTLETIGKKTMEVLQEGDPGLKKKRAMFTDKTVLSQVLRDAKEKAELESKEAENRQSTRVVHFETLFDDYQGLVHLEALEMLSKQCGMKLQSLLLANSGPALAAWQAKLQGIKDSCQLPDDEDLPDDSADQAKEWQEKLSQAEKALGVPMAIEKLSNRWVETAEWIAAARGEEGESASTHEIHEKAVSTLARLTAIAVEQFHKGAELLLVQESREPFQEAPALITITTVLCSQVSTTASRFCELLNDVNEGPKSDDVNSLITNIFLEASNSSSYIQEAFQLLIPVLQVGLVSSK